MSRMPALFVGHGSPMNAIEENQFTENWVKLSAKIPRPSAILAISAHWYTEGTRINDDSHPKMTYDMYGFPKELYEVKYNSPGAPEMAAFTKSLINRKVMVDNSWGYDHGTWSVLQVMYPAKDIPVYQLSVDRTIGGDQHFQLGQELKQLRDKAVLILGSGNVVHNLYRVNFGMAGGYDWAKEFDAYIKEKVVARQYQEVIDYRSAGKASELAFTTPEHFYPLLYVLGASDPIDEISVVNDACAFGSLSMTSYLFE